MNFQLLFMKRGLFHYTIPDLLTRHYSENGEYCRLKAILIQFSIHAN